MYKATLWMMLGDKWEYLRDKFGTLENGMPVHRYANEPEGIDNSDYWSVIYCEDIVRYFFPNDFDVFHSFFSPPRRDWNGPYDRRELVN